MHYFDITIFALNIFSETFSFRIAFLSPSNNETPDYRDRFIARADAALYDSNRQDKNKIYLPDMNE